MILAVNSVQDAMRTVEALLLDETRQAELTELLQEEKDKMQKLAASKDDWLSNRASEIRKVL